MKRRVVITGLGIVTAIGVGVEEFWKAAISCKNGITPIEAFDTAEYPNKNGGEIKYFDATKYLSEILVKKLGRASQYALIAAQEALKDARLTSVDCQGAGVIIGTTMGEGGITEEICRDIYHKKSIAEYRSAYSKWAPYSINNIVNQELGLTGDSLLIPNACSAGNFSIGYAYNLIQQGKRDLIIAGGADPLSEIAFSGFSKLKTMADDTCRPFDKNRRGMIVGEGAGILIIESLEHALKRGAKIYAEILGYGASSDAYHMVMSHPEAEGIITAVEKALTNAGITPDEVDYISAHGTGTVSNDLAETLAMKAIFKEHYRKVPISSLKSMIGHTLGAAGAIAAAACCMSFRNNTILPTINFETPDPECDVDCVPNQPREAELNIVLNNAYAFGGSNSCLVLKRY
ncbi:MAG: beta-ketoacyl-[acyl-carrier-protein] synthase family protein [Bacteroidota bacterium]